MDMQNYARMREEQLNEEILGLDEKIAEVSDRGGSEQRCVSAYLKQLVKTKRQKLAVLRHRRS